MRYILTKLRRGRRRHRIPHGLLVSAALMVTLVITMTVAASLFAIPASAKMRDHIPMPRTEDGIVTDGDGIIDSDGMAGDIPDVTDLLPGGSGMNEGSDALDPVVSGTEGARDSGTTAESTTEKATTAESTNMVEDAADSMGISPWIVGLIILAVVAVIIVIIIRFASGTRGKD